MQIYLVGGAVRDMILGITPQDKDYVVVGASPKEMLSLGYKQVGKDFPVFLHPQTKEEYALARKETLIGSGHKDFTFEFIPDITLEEDLIRRDFTCNALAYDEETKEIIDLFGGIKDIKNHILRHISPHFIEDPLRVLRACRFAAQLNFTIAPETLNLCQQIASSGALSTLSAERIWQEIFKALSSPHFAKFIASLQDCKAFSIIMPEINTLPDKLADLNIGTPQTKLAILLQKSSANERSKFCNRLRIPKHYANFINLCVNNLNSFLQVSSNNCSALFDLVCNTSAQFKKLKQLENFMQFCQVYCPKEKFIKQKSLCLATYNLLKNTTAINMPNFHDLNSHDIAEAYRIYRVRLLENYFKS